MRYVAYGDDSYNPLPHRILRLPSGQEALDDVVFDALGLTEAEREEVYWAVCELVPPLAG
jgi:hypothetical protein